MEETLFFHLFDTSYVSAITFKVYGYLVGSGSLSSDMISAFSNRNDVLSGILKKKEIKDADSIINGTLMTNLTRLDFPKTYG